MFKAILVGLASLIGIGVLVFTLSYAGFLHTAFFAPLYEGVRRDVMIESRAYSEGTIQQLYKLKREYDKAKDPDTKATIVASARHQFSIFPEDRLPPDLRAWMNQIK